MGWRFVVSVVRRFVLVRRDVSDGRVQSSRVVPVDPPSGYPFDVVDRAQRAGAEGRTVSDCFVLEQPDRRLGQGIVVRVADRSDRRGDPLERAGEKFEANGYSEKAVDRILKRQADEQAARDEECRGRPRNGRNDRAVRGMGPAVPAVTGSSRRGRSCAMRLAIMTYLARSWVSQCWDTTTSWSSWKRSPLWSTRQGDHRVRAGIEVRPARARV